MTYKTLFLPLTNADKHMWVDFDYHVNTGGVYELFDDSGLDAFDDNLNDLD